MRVEQIKQQRAEEERLNAERSEEAKKLLAELSTLVDKAEQDTAELKTAAAPVLEAKSMSEEEAKTAGGAEGEMVLCRRATCS